MSKAIQAYVKLTLSVVLLFACLPESSAGRVASLTPDTLYSAHHKPTPKAADSLNATPKQKYVKRGMNFVPLPAISFSSDLGVQLGAILDIYWFGDGSTYPDYLHKITAEACYFTKGSGIYYLFYDSKYLIKGIRLTASASYLPNTMMAFQGFNGYQSPYYKEHNAGFYAIERNMLRIIADTRGKIAGHWDWAAGLSFYNYDTGRIKVKKYREDRTLYDIYKSHGIIRDDESAGGSHIELRAGIIYDTRDNEPDPSRGIYADLILFGSPDIIGRKGYDYLKAGVTFRHYVPLISNRLTLAYKISWQGRIAGRQPFYVLQNYAAFFPKQINTDILGGAVSLRGILYNRVVGDAMAWANVEARLRLFSFRLIGQEWYVTTNPFFDAGMVTGPFREGDIKKVYNDVNIPEEERREIYSGDSETLHMSAGIGFKLVMNRNFVLSAEYGIPFDKRDGNGGIYLNLNYIF